MSAGAISRLQLWQAGRRVLSTSLLAAICIALLHCLAIGAEEFGLARDNESDGDQSAFSSLYHGGTSISDGADTVELDEPNATEPQFFLLSRLWRRRNRYHRSRRKRPSRSKSKSKPKPKPKPEPEPEPETEPEPEPEPETEKIPFRKTCGKLPNYSSGSFRINHGKRAKRDEWPFVVHLQVQLKKGWVSCTGSIISDKWIVTAAHCVEQSNITTITITFRLHGLDQLRNPEAFGRGVSKVITHENFDTSKSKLLNDIALIKLAEPLTFNEGVQPICLTNQEDTVRASRNQECYTIGYGMMGDTLVPDYMQKIPTEVKDPQECERPKGIKLFKNTICVGPRRGRKGSSCSGDSGGPTACYDEHNEGWTLRGLVSYGPGECERKEGRTWNSVSTDVGKFRHWIKRTMDNN